MTHEEMKTLIRCQQGGYEFIGGGNETTLIAAAESWIANGFSADAEDWWRAGCFDADRSAEMRDSGLTPADIDVDCPGFPGTSWGYARCNSDVSFNDVISACQIA